jgi:hypothetical protein
MSTNVLDKARSLIALADKATRGPWEAGGVALHSLTFDHEANVFPPLGESGPVAVVHADHGEMRSPDADFIAESRTTAPELARAIVSLDKFTRDMLDHYKPTGAADTEAEMVSAVLFDLRRRLGLPATPKEQP